MIRLHLDADHLDALLASVSSVALRYHRGCLEGEARLPLGGVTLVAVPSFRDGALVIAIPLRYVRGRMTGGLLGGLANLAWGPLRAFLEGQIETVLRRFGLPRDTVTIDKRDDEDGEPVGFIRIRADRVNEWLQHQRQASPFVFFVEGMYFQETAAGVFLSLRLTT